MDLSIHNFEKKTYTRPTKCTFCNKFLLGLSKQGLQCHRCHIDVHAGCLVQAKQKLACLNSAQANSAIPQHPTAVDMTKLTLDGGNLHHNFKAHTFTSPTFCAVCNKLLAGVYKQGFRCEVCKLSVHKGCQDAAMSSIECDRDIVATQYHQQGAELKSKLRATKANITSKAAAATAKMKTEVRRLRSSNTEEKPSQFNISGPTNVHQIAGTTKLEDRKLIPIEQIKKSSYPGSGFGENLNVSPVTDSESCSLKSLDEPLCDTAKIDDRTQVRSSILSERADIVADIAIPKDCSRDTLASSREIPPKIPRRPSSRDTEHGSTTINQSQNNAFSSASGTPTSSLPPPPPAQPVDSLPPGWFKLVDERTGSPYYYNRELGVTQWERP
mmetsp:Transcript_11253/g.14677  ORF Transcript_11253/g.14677 Transcript_11253/m.14677 type:complete len:384 (+) Transcript_11253:185-1336(+)